MSKKNENLKLSDATIGQIARVLQLAILSGTDIVDHLRQVRLVNEDGELNLNTEYSDIFENNLDTMMQEIAQHNGPQGMQVEADLAPPKDVGDN